MAEPHAKARPIGDVRDFLTAYAKAGGPHHLAVCKGDARVKLAALARFINADYVEI
jgi:L-arabinose isomerase